MKVLVVDEEKYSSRKLERMLRKFDRSIDISATFSNIDDCIGWMKQHGSTDLILVSKELIGNKSDELISQFGLEATVIFSLQDDEYHFTAFRTNSLEFLLQSSPFAAKKEPASFQASTIQPRAFIGENRNTQQEITYRNRFLVKQGQRFVSIEVSDIAYFFSFERFVYFKTFQENKYLVEYSLEELLSMLDRNQFFRINRSLMISFKSVKQISPHTGNRLKLNLYPPFEKEVIVSREKMHDFKQWLGE